MATFEGTFNAAGIRYGIVVSRFNELITRPLLDGAMDALRRHGADLEQVDIAWVPGSWEIPVAARQMAQSGRYDGIICLGAVIRGATAHFDHVAGQAASGIARVGMDTGIPVTFGVLTTDSLEQAFERAGSKAGNKGAEAALAAVEMVTLLRQIRTPGQYQV